MDRKKIIELLNLDLQDEHGAIIQYLMHAYAIGEGELACEIEAIARDEMRHLDWLAETIVELGGQPSLVRGKQNMAGKTVPEWMGNDVGLESGAIDSYEQHIKVIDNLKIKRLLNRILLDEKSHRTKFEGFIQKAQREGLKDLRGTRDDSTSRTMDWAIGHEYTVVLQYMFHSYMNKDKEAKKQLEDQAINEMQHLGWLSEELVSGGGSPVIEHAEINQSLKPADALKADIKIENEVAERYDKASKDANDPSIKELFSRISSHEKYHVDVFNELLKDEESR